MRQLFSPDVHAQKRMLFRAMWQQEVFRITGRPIFDFGHLGEVSLPFTW